jgi:hypothetical protein
MTPDFQSQQGTGDDTLEDVQRAMFPVVIGELIAKAKLDYYQACHVLGQRVELILVIADENPEPVNSERLLDVYCQVAEHYRAFFHDRNQMPLPYDGETLRGSRERCWRAWCAEFTSRLLKLGGVPTLILTILAHEKCREGWGAYYELGMRLNELFSQDRRAHTPQPDGST